MTVKFLKAGILTLIFLFTLTFAYSEATDDISSSDNNQLPEGISRNNINFIVVIDVSKSMVKNFRELQNYTVNSIVGKILINGDYFNCFTFGEFIKPRIEKKIVLPDDNELLKKEIYGILPDENFTDIGLALETLDNLISSNTFPYERTIVFFITDGKNAPPKTSRYTGVDIFSSGAFKFYSEIKSGDFKVMLLSIGNQTAATDLSQPMGGEFIEMSPSITADDLNEKIKDFVGSIEMDASLKNNDINTKTVVITLSSSYSGKKTVKINDINIIVDEVKVDTGNYQTSLEMNPGENKNIEVTFKLPDTIMQGGHDVRIELDSENNLVTKSIKKIQFEKKTDEPALITEFAELDSSAIVFAIIALAITILATAFYSLYMLSIVSFRSGNKKK